MRKAGSAIFFFFFFSGKEILFFTKSLIFIFGVLEQVVDRIKSLDINLLLKLRKVIFILVFTVIKDYGTFYYLSDFAMSVLILHLN